MDIQTGQMRMGEHPDSPPLEVLGLHPLQRDLQLFNPPSQKCLPPPLPAPDQCLLPWLPGPTAQARGFLGTGLPVWCTPSRCITSTCVDGGTSPEAPFPPRSPRALRKGELGEGILVRKRRKAGRKKRITPHQNYRAPAQRGDVTSPNS